MKRNLIVLVYFGLAVSTLLVFWQVRHFGFVDYDDNIYVYENPHVLDGLTPDGIIWAFTTGSAANWHPITWLSFMLDCQLFGAAPGRMHLVNLLLHLANVLLLFTVLRKMTGSLWPSAFVAAAFALHPMHVESVVWIAERKDVLSTFFWFLTMGAYLVYVRRPGVIRYTLTLVLFMLGLMTKPMLVTLPFVLLLFDYWPLDRLAVSQITGGKLRKSLPTFDHRRVLYRLIGEKVPFLIMAVLSSVVTFWVQRLGGAMPEINDISLQSRVANVFLSYARYIGKMFWPQDLAVFYPFDVSRSPLWQISACVLLLLGVSIWAIRVGRTRRYFPVGWFWFLGTLIPVIGLVQVGWQSHADRYTYIPYTGLFIMIAWGLPEFLSRWPQRKIVLGLSMVLAAAVLGRCAHQQVGYWKNSLVLFTHAIEVTRNNAIMHNNRGVAYNAFSRWYEAIADFNEVLRIKPDYAEAYNNRGVAYNALDRREEAIADFNEALRIKPDFAEGYFNRGAAYNVFSRWYEAIADFNEVLRIKPDYAEAYNNRGAAYNALGRRQEAIADFTQALRIKPDLAEAYNNLDRIIQAGSNLEEAIVLAQRACELTHHRHAGLLCTLASAYLSAGRFPEAAHAAEAALKIAPNLVNAHGILGTALSSEGDFKNAIIHMKRILEIEPNSITAKNNLAWILATNPDPAIRNPSDAIRLAEEACHANRPEDPTFLDTLGAAYASGDRFTEAAQTTEKALMLVADANQIELKTAIEQRLMLYKQNKPYVESARGVIPDVNEP